MTMKPRRRRRSPVSKTDQPKTQPPPPEKPAEATPTPVVVPLSGTSGGKGTAK